MQPVSELIIQIFVGLFTISLGVYLRRRAGEAESAKALRLFANMAFVIGFLMVLFAVLLLLPRPEPATMRDKKGRLRASETAAGLVQSDERSLEVSLFPFLYRKSSPLPLVERTPGAPDGWCRP